MDLYASLIAARRQLAQVVQGDHVVSIDHQFWQARACLPDNISGRLPLSLQTLHQDQPPGASVDTMSGCTTDTCLMMHERLQLQHNYIMTYMLAYSACLPCKTLPIGRVVNVSSTTERCSYIMNVPDGPSAADAFTPSHALPARRLHATRHAGVYYVDAVTSESRRPRQARSCKQPRPSTEQLLQDNQVDGCLAAYVTASSAAATHELWQQTIVCLSKQAKSTAVITKAASEVRAPWHAAQFSKHRHAI